MSVCSTTITTWDIKNLVHNGINYLSTYQLSTVLPDFFLGKFPPEANWWKLWDHQSTGPRVVLGGEMGGSKRCTEQNSSIRWVGPFLKEGDFRLPFFFCVFWLLLAFGFQQKPAIFLSPQSCWISSKLRKFRQSILHQTFNLWICSSNFGGSLGEACNLWGCWLSSQMTQPRWKTARWQTWICWFCPSDIGGQMRAFLQTKGVMFQTFQNSIELYSLLWKAKPFLQWLRKSTVETISRFSYKSRFSSSQKQTAQENRLYPQKGKDRRSNQHFSGGSS